MPAIETVQVGDVIVEGRDQTVITKVEVDACSSRGTHINNKYCYDRGSFVQLKRRASPNKDEVFEEYFDPGVLV